MPSFSKVDDAATRAAGAPTSRGLVARAVLAELAILWWPCFSDKRI